MSGKNEGTKPGFFGNGKKKVLRQKRTRELRQSLALENKDAQAAGGDSSNKGPYRIVWTGAADWSPRPRLARCPAIKMYEDRLAIWRCKNLLCFLYKVLYTYGLDWVFVRFR